jgi:hypothetical protein
VATGVRFLMMRAWVFRPTGRGVQA